MDWIVRAPLMCTEAEFMDEIQTKVLWVFLFAIPGHLFTFALRFLFLQNHATSYSFFNLLLYTVKEKGGKLDTKLWFKKSREKPQVLELKIMPRNLIEIVRSLIRLLYSLSPHLPQFQQSAGATPLSSLSGKKLHIKPDIFPIYFFFKVSFFCRLGNAEM